MNKNLTASPVGFEHATEGVCVTAQPPELRLVQPQYYPCFVGPLQASGGIRRQAFPPEMNLGKPTDKQKKMCRRGVGAILDRDAK